MYLALSVSVCSVQVSFFFWGGGGGGSKIEKGGFFPISSPLACVVIYFNLNLDLSLKYKVSLVNNIT